VIMGIAQSMSHGAQVTVGFGKASGLYTYKPVRLSTTRPAVSSARLSAS